MQSPVGRSPGVARRVLIDLAVRDYQRQYQGTYLGFVWMFLQPLLFIAVLYMIFTVGFRAQRTVDMPFGLYLVCGMISWNYISGNLGAITGIVRAHAYLVKKVDVDLSVLPAVKLLSSLLPHLFLIGFAIGVAWWQGYEPAWYTLQVFYYLGASMVLLTGLGWISCSTSLFVRDVSNIVTVVTQFGFWLTPVFWNIRMIPDQYHWLIKLNPAVYVVTGYRDSIVAGIPLWDRWAEGAYFWSLALAICFIGHRVFKRLRPHFAEVV
ncbi:MAG: ABC transporter permease [Pseudomonadales bacterium]